MTQLVNASMRNTKTNVSFVERLAGEGMIDQNSTAVAQNGSTELEPQPEAGEQLEREQYHLPSFKSYTLAGWDGQKQGST